MSDYYSRDMKMHYKRDYCVMYVIGMHIKIIKLCCDYYAQGFKN